MRRFGLIGRPLGHSASAAYFTEKFNKDYGTTTIHVLPEGQKLLTRLYHEGKLIMKKGFTAPSRDKGVSHAA